MAVGPTIVPVAGHLNLTTSAASTGIGNPVSLNVTLSTSSSATLVDPDKLYVTLPKSFGINAATAAIYGTPVFGTAASGGMVGSPATGAKPIGSVYVVSSELQAFVHTNSITGKLYLVSGVSGGLDGFGLEIAVPFGPVDVDFLAPIIESPTTKLSTIQFTNLDIPNSLTGQPNPSPLPWSTFQVTMPAKSSVALANKCGGPGAAGSVAAQLEDYGASSLSPAITKGVTVVCPPSLMGRAMRAMSGKPTLSLTAKARGGAFSSMILFMPKTVKITKAIRKDIKVSGARVKRIRKMGNKLEIVFKSPTNKATVKISKVVRLNSKVVAKLKHHKKVSVTIRLRTNLAGSTSAKIKL